jgi:hypothetical protein
LEQNIVDLSILANKIDPIIKNMNEKYALLPSLRSKLDLLIMEKEKTVDVRIENQKLKQ